MKRDRLQLHEILCDILGSRNCYFSPPSTIQMKYPCFVYHLSILDINYADNIPYMGAKRYTITAITEDPDSDFQWDLLKLPYCSFERPFTTDNLNHYVFNLYF